MKISQSSCLVILILTMGFICLIPSKEAIARRRVKFTPPEIPDTIGAPGRRTFLGSRVYVPPEDINGPENVNQEGDFNHPILRPRLPIPAPVNPGTPRVGSPRPQPTPTQSPANPQTTASLTEGSCLKNKKALTALIPESNLGLTITDNPTLYFYVPETNAYKLELIVRNKELKLVYSQSYKPNTMSGVFGLKLAANSLKVGEQYSWRFKVVCNPSNANDIGVVEGTIKRISPTSKLKSQLRKAKTVDIPAIYAESGIWQDGITKLVELLYTYPKDITLKADWQGLLTAKGVNFNSQLTQEPLIPHQATPQPIK
jgi:Domain of Unknown Function (DUF928)